MTEREHADSPGHARTPGGGRRLVLFLPGHDPTDMDYHHGRFAYQAQRFAELWSLKVEVTPRLDDGREPLARWTASAQGPNWRQETDYGILRWDDIVVELDERANPVRLRRGLTALWEFLLNGTAGRYLKATVRYGLFCLFPLLLVALFIAAAALAGGLVAALLAKVAPLLLAIAGGAAAGIIAFFGLFHQPGRHWRLHQALDDWDLAREYLHRRTPTVDARMKRFADILVETVNAQRHEEIVLVGHSLGATLILGVMDRALDREPALASGHTRLSLLTCGATIPKLALHPAGGWVRAQAQRVAALPGLCWVEYQARHDAINFYKFHPVRLKRAAFDDPADGAPRLRDANIKRMLTREKLHRLRWHAMRIHYQFLLANERPAAYDYFMFALGPLSFPYLSSRPDGPVGLFGPDGALLAKPTDLP